MSVPRPAMLVAMVTCAFAACLGDDLRLALVMLGVEHLMVNAASIEQVPETFALFDRHRTDQNRAAGRLDLAILSRVIVSRRALLSQLDSDRLTRLR